MSNKTKRRATRQSLKGMTKSKTSREETQAHKILRPANGLLRINPKDLEESGRLQLLTTQDARLERRDNHAYRGKMPPRKRVHESVSRMDARGTLKQSHGWNEHYGLTTEDEEYIAGR